jgi:hypothetical protein
VWDGPQAGTDQSKPQGEYFLLSRSTVTPSVCRCVWGCSVNTAQRHLTEEMGDVACILVQGPCAPRRRNHFCDDTRPEVHLLCTLHIARIWLHGGSLRPAPLSPLSGPLAIPNIHSGFTEQLIRNQPLLPRVPSWQAHFPGSWSWGTRQQRAARGRDPCGES